MKLSHLTKKENKKLTWADIKAKRNELEQSPIAVNGLLYDCDLISLKRMEWAVMCFNDLPTVVEGKITWKLADNSFIELTYEELLAVFNAVPGLVAARSAMLHYRAEVIAQMNHLKVKDLDKPELWYGIEE